jgi:hypothetical protein
VLDLRRHREIHAVTPFLSIAVAAMTLTSRLIELRLAQYDAVPELREQDAANALIWSTWGGRLLVLLERLSRELGLEEPPG